MPRISSTVALASAAGLSLVLLSPACMDEGPSRSTGGAGTSGAGTAGTGASPTGAAGTAAPSGAAGTGEAGASASGQAGTGAAGTTVAAGSAGSVGSPGTAGAGASGSVGTTGAAGTGAGTAGAGAGGDLYPAPPRAINLMVDGRSEAQISFAPSAADPGAKSFHGNNYAVLRNKPTGGVVQKKLVIGLHGVGNGAGPGGALGWAAGRGFHVMGIDYANNTGGSNGDGNGYLETWSGEDKCTCVDVKPVDSIMNRVKTGLAYLQTKDPGADWAYYLNADGSVRWNDVIAFGYSFGGQTVVAATKYVGLARAIPVSAPGLSSTSAPWLLSMPAKTPVSLSYVISGTTDGGHANHIKCVNELGWPGPTVNTMTTMPPYNNSHILEVNFGHSEFCSIGQFDAVCDYAFGTIKM